MSYVNTLWKDHAISPQNRYTMTDNGDGTVTLVPYGTVVQQGTNMNAANFGNMEGGIMAAVVEATEALRMCGKLQDDISGVQPLVIQATLSNSQAYPFNNSKATIAIPTNDTRYDTGYIVIPEVVSYSGGGVKDIVISDKLVNGFKAEFTGGATSAVVKFYVVGGRNG